jgi:SAM-dependent methyltransferase
MSENKKYENKNPIHQFLLNKFLASATRAIRSTRLTDIVEVGCADGYVYGFLQKHMGAPFTYRGFDIDREGLQIAKSRFPEGSFEYGDIYNLKVQGEVVVCMEVFEHLERPEEALKNLASTPAKYFVISVPHEPFFQLGNLARGRHRKTWGNLPDHINHWGKRSFKKFLSAELDVVADYSSLPWIVYLAKKK